MIGTINRIKQYIERTGFRELFGAIAPGKHAEVDCQSPGGVLNRGAQRQTARVLGSAHNKPQKLDHPRSAPDSFGKANAFRKGNLNGDVVLETGFCGYLHSRYRVVRCGDRADHSFGRENLPLSREVDHLSLGPDTPLAHGRFFRHDHFD